MDGSTIVKDMFSGYCSSVLEYDQAIIKILSGKIRVLSARPLALLTTPRSLSLTIKCLVVPLDSTLSMENFISQSAKFCYNQLRRISSRVPSGKTMVLSAKTRELSAKTRVPSGKTRVL